METNSVKPGVTSVNFHLSFGMDPENGAAVAESAKSKQVETSKPSDVLLNAYSGINELKRTEQKGGQLNLSDEHFMKVLEKAFKAMDGRSTTLQFSVHDKTHQIMIKVMDKDSGEVIREIPPEKTFDFLAKVQEMLGLFVDVRR